MTVHLEAIEMPLEHTTWNSFGTWKMGVQPILACPCSGPSPCPGAVWKVLYEMIQPIHPGLVPGLHSSPS